MRKIIPYLFFLIFVSDAFCCYAQNASDIKEIDKAISQMKKGNDREAIGVFLKLLQRYPGNYEVNYNLGTALLHFKQYDSAIRYFNTVIKTDPLLSPVYVNRSIAYLELHDTLKALADARIAITLTPVTAESYSNLGFMLGEQKKYDEAIPYLDDAIAIDKTFCDAYLNKSSVLHELGRDEESVELLNKIMPYEPAKLDMVYENRAKSYFSLGEYNEALADCDKAISLNKKNTEAYILRSKIKDELGDDQGAVDDCSIAIGIDSTNAEFYSERATRKFDLQDYSGIIADCTKAIELDPAHYNAYVQRANAYDYLLLFKKATPDYDKAIALQPHTFYAYRERASSLIHQSDLSTALIFIDKALEIKPDDQFLLSNKFYINLNYGDNNSALSTLDAWIKACNDTSPVLYLRKAEIYYAAHNEEDACKNAYECLKHHSFEGYDFIVKHKCEYYMQTALVKAIPFMQDADNKRAMQDYAGEIKSRNREIELLPDSADGYFNRGLAKSRLKRFDEAIEDYTKAFTLNPKFTDAVASRGLVNYDKNNLEAAEKDYKLALSIDSTFSAAYNNYGLLYYISDPAKAAAFFSKAIKYNSKAAEAYFNRAEMYIKLSRNGDACKDYNKAYELGIAVAKEKSLLYCK